MRPAADSYSDPAPRQLAVYECARGHEVTAWFSAEARIPPAWQCRCGAPAAPPGVQPGRPGESEYERRLRLLLMRRSRGELEQLLGERLASITGPASAGPGLRRQRV